MNCCCVWCIIFNTCLHILQSNIFGQNSVALCNSLNIVVYLVTRIFSCVPSTGWLDEIIPIVLITDVPAELQKYFIHQTTKLFPVTTLPRQTRIIFRWQSEWMKLNSVTNKVCSTKRSLLPCNNFQVLLRLSQIISSQVTLSRSLLFSQRWLSSTERLTVCN